MKQILSLFLCVFALGAYAQETPTVDTLQTTENASDSTVQTENTAPQEATVDENIEPPSEVEQEPEIIYAEEEVFSPQFMKNLMQCQPDKEAQNERFVEIIGPKEDYCLLKYANFDLNVPLTLLTNIHGIDDVETLLKNKDIAHYNYRADYIYDGLMYALNACFNKNDYDGKQEELADEYVTINRGLDAEFTNGMCTIYLSNTQNVEGVITDYGVTCTLSYKEVQNLEPYFKDLAEKYGKKRGFSSDGHIMVTREQKNKQTHEADIALMYYLQKHGFCKKNTK